MLFDDLESDAADDGATFAEFWQTYPRRVAKKYAEQCWRRAVRDIAKEKKIGQEAAARWLNDRVAAFAKSEAGNRGEFVPHPSTWLNQGRYDDDLEAWGGLAAAEKPKLRSVDEINAERRW